MKRLVTICAAVIGCLSAQSGIAGDFYVQIRVGNDETLLAVVDLDTGEAVPVGPLLSPVCAAFDFPDVGSELVGTSNGRLYSWDYLTGDAVAGATLPNLGNSRTTFAFDTNGIAYAFGSSFGSTTLFRVDTNTSAQTVVGNIGFQAGNNGGDITPDGTLYFLCADPVRNNGQNSSLYILDKFDASHRFVGRTGRPLRGCDLASDCHGNLYGITDPDPDDGLTAMLFSVSTADAASQDIVEVWSPLGEVLTANLAWGPGEGCPPEIACSLRTDSLWAPNHKLENVGLEFEILSGRTVTETTVEVYSDEAEEGQTGDGNHSPDAVDIAAGTLQLRRERKGDGDGRVYLIIITATDDFGRTGFECCTVTVPHSKSKAAADAVAQQALLAEAECLVSGGEPPSGFVRLGR